MYSTPQCRQALCSSSKNKRQLFFILRRLFFESKTVLYEVESEFWIFWINFLFKMIGAYLLKFLSNENFTKSVTIL